VALISTMQALFISAKDSGYRYGIKYYLVRKVRLLAAAQLSYQSTNSHSLYKLCESRKFQA